MNGASGGMCWDMKEYSIREVGGTSTGFAGNAGRIDGEIDARHSKRHQGRCLRWGSANAVMPSCWPEPDEHPSQQRDHKQGAERRSDAWPVMHTRRLGRSTLSKALLDACRYIVPRSDVSSCSSEESF